MPKYDPGKKRVKSKIIEQKDKVFIDNIPPLRWHENTDNCFIRSSQLTLNALGENYSYDFLMGISGAAFRLHFHPDWCPSSADSTTGFDVSRILFKSLGYKSVFHRINDNSFDDIKALYQKIIKEINFGRPIIAINLKACTEWGIITGYLKNKPGILCRTYFDETDEYSLADRAPWLTFFIEKNDKPKSADALFKNSLEIAIQLAKTETFEEYTSGFGAFTKWIDELKKYTDSSKSKIFDKGEVNLTIYEYLIDSRRAAMKYLLSMNSKLKNGELIIKNYKNEVELLVDNKTKILPSYDAKSTDWTKEIINQQIKTLTQVLNIEKENIGLFKKELI